MSGTRLPSGTAFFEYGVLVKIKVEDDMILGRETGTKTKD